MTKNKKRILTSILVSVFGFVALNVSDCNAESTCARLDFSTEYESGVPVMYAECYEFSLVGQEATKEACSSAPVREIFKVVGRSKFFAGSCPKEGETLKNSTGAQQVLHWDRRFSCSPAPSVIKDLRIFQNDIALRWDIKRPPSSLSCQEIN